MHTYIRTAKKIILSCLHAQNVLPNEAIVTFHVRATPEPTNNGRKLFHRKETPTHWPIIFVDLALGPVLAGPALDAMSGTTA